MASAKAHGAAAGTAPPMSVGGPARAPAPGPSTLSLPQGGVVVYVPAGEPWAEEGERGKPRGTGVPATRLEEKNMMTPLVDLRSRSSRPRALSDSEQLAALHR